MKTIHTQQQNINIPSRALNTWSESLCADNVVFGFPYNKQNETPSGQICKDVISI